MVDSQFTAWLAGFVDGEGCFYIASWVRGGNRVYRPRFSLSLRADDRAILEDVVRRTGIGTLHEYEPSGPGRRVIRWMVQSQADCAALALVLDGELRSKKRRDFEVWRRGVAEAAGLRRGPVESNARVYAQLADSKREIEAVRAYA